MSNFMCRLNPACKFLGLMVLTLTLAFVHDPVVNLIVFVVCLLLTLTSGANLRHVFGLYLPILLVAAGAFMTGFRYSTNGDLPSNLSSVLVSDTHIGNGLIFATRVLVYASIGFVFAFTTDRVQLIRSFEKQLHMPQLFAYGLLAAWGIFPQMMKEYSRTRAAFRARGLHPLPFSPAVLKPLLVKSVRWSEALAVAMESKGFDGAGERSSFGAPVVKTLDRFFLAVSCLGIPIAIAVFIHFF